MNPFDYLNSVNYEKQNLMVDDVSESQYNAFMVNRGLSYFPDSILYANQMNGFEHLDNKLQYEFYLHGLTKRKRFSKWSKKDDITDKIRAVMDYYKYSHERALQAISILSDEQITIIEEKMYKGGRT